MYKMLLALVLSVIGQVPTLVNAVELTPDGRFPSNDSLCGLIVSMQAELVMSSRQLGKPISDVITMAEDSDEKFGWGTMKEMVLAAYELPRWNTVENRMKAVEDFSNDWTLACYKAQR